MPISISKSSNFYGKILSVGIDSAIAGLTADNSTKLIFTTQTPNGGVNPVFIRSTTCWAKNIDTTPCSVWNSSGGFNKAGTLISPRHILYNTHYGMPLAAVLIFVDMNNNCYTRTLSNSLQIGSTDITIGLLDSDLPSSVSFCKVLNLDINKTTNFQNRSMFPTLYTDQEQKALIGEYYNIGYDAGLAQYMSAIRIPTISQRAQFWEAPIGGDSSDPVSFIYNNKMILLFTFWFSDLVSYSSGPNISYYINEINSAMINLGGGYTLSIEDIAVQEKNISIKKQSAGSGKITLKKS